MTETQSLYRSQIWTPSPRGHHLLPSQRATRLAGTPPTDRKLPPAYRSFPRTRNALTVGKHKAPRQLSRPPPRFDQLFPSHLAIELARFPPAVLNMPPTYTSFSATSIALTHAKVSPLTPKPNPSSHRSSFERSAASGILAAPITPGMPIRKAAISISGRSDRLTCGIRSDMWRIRRPPIDVHLTGNFNLSLA